MPTTLEFLQAGWLLLPAGIANALPPLVKKINFLNYPVDFGVTLRGRPLLGASKTIRGLFFAVLIAIIITYCQAVVYKFQLGGISKIAVIDYASVNIFYLGFCLGTAAMIGDLLASFLKRQLGIMAGQPFFFMDQLDWIISSGLAVFIIYSVKIKILLLAAIIYFVLHILVKWLGYFVGVNNTKL